jgi:hypothetical protein
VVSESKCTESMKYGVGNFSGRVQIETMSEVCLGGIGRRALNF